MSYIIKKQKFLKSLDRIKELCESKGIEMPTLLRDYPIKSNEEYDGELKGFLEIFSEFSDIAIDLNKEQEEIVTYNGDKFLSVEAGPGAGKTRVLIEKVNYMVNELNVDPQSLLIITFSTKAAEELQERLAEGDLLKSDVQKMHISTIHAFCGKILEESGQVGLNVISDEAGEKNLLFIGKHMEELGFTHEAYMSNGEIPDIVNKYNEYCSFDVKTDELIEYIEDTRPISPEYVDFVREYMEAHDGKYPYDEVKENKEFKKSKYNAKYLQIAKSYKIYEEILKREKAIDFAHMQKDALEIVKKDNFKTQFTNILIDEFQDTDPMQMALFEELMKQSESFTVVGDINQSIYGFRGSNTNPFTYLAKHHKDEFEFMSLPTNYRSTYEIIDVSEDFIKHQRPVESALGKAECGREIHNDIYYLVNENSGVEANGILKIIQYLIENNKINKLSDIGILFRSLNSSSSRCIEGLLEKLEGNDINYQIRGLSDLAEQPEIRSVLTLFFHLVSDDDPHKYFFNKWEKDWLNLNAYADQILFDLSDETKQILYDLQDKFEEEVVKKENEIWLRDHKSGGKKSFAKVFDRDEEMLIEIFESVTRPVLANENLIEYGITNENDLKFFKRLNDLKDSLYADDIKFYDRPTVSEVYLKLLTEVSGFLTEDKILDDGDKLIYNLSQLTSSLQTFVDVRFERDIRGAFWFIYRTISGHSSYREESDGIQIMTIHQSKGLEFPVVIIPSFKHEKFPMKYINPNPESGWIFGKPTYYTPYDCLNYPKFDAEFGPELSHEMEEERVIYVAMTRAQDTLILSSIVDDCGAAKQVAIEREEYRNLPKGPNRLQNAINENLDYCKFIDINNIDINVLPRKVEEVDDEDYCIDLSFTALENYNNCPFRYKLANGVGFSISEKQEIDEGIFVHKALEIINKEIINNDNVYVGDGEVVKIITELFEKSNEDLKEEDLVEYEKQLKEIIDNVLYYFDNYGKDIKILDSEYPFYLKDQHYALKGVVDLIYETYDGKLGIIDYKNTRLEFKYKDKFKNQLHLYILALRDQNQEYEGKEISKLQVYTIKSKKMLDIDIEEDYIEELKVELETVASNIHKGVFESCKCDDCKYCSYKNICKQNA